MNWPNLREGLCPGCGDELLTETMSDMITCPCGFKVRKERMVELLDKFEEDERYREDLGRYN